MSIQANLAEWANNYRVKGPKDEPVTRFAYDTFGLVLDDWQREVGKWYSDRERLISIASCHRPGKSFLCCMIAWFQSCTTFPQNTVVTAPSKSQLFDVLMKEFRIRHDAMPEWLHNLFDISKDRVVFKPSPAGSFISLRTARAEAPEALQGVHCEGGRVLLIGDEASGIPEAVYDSAQGSMAGDACTTILISNPTKTSGHFYETHHSMRHRWRTKQIGYQDSKRVSADFVEEVAEKYGRNSNQFRIRCEGKFPQGDEESIISREIAEAAVGRDIWVPEDLPEVWGLDVARSNSRDRNALIRRNNLEVKPKVMAWYAEDTMKTVDRVWKEYDKAEEKPVAVIVDAIGIGAGVADRLKQVGIPSRALNVSEAQTADEQYHNLKAKLWFDAEEWLAARNVRMPRCDGGCKNHRECVHRQLIDEISVVRYKESKQTGKILVESKEELRKRLRRSTDIADAFVMTFALDVSAMAGLAKRGGWGRRFVRKVPNRGMA